MSRRKSFVTDVVIVLAIIALLVAVVVGLPATQAAEQQPQKFKATFTIVYNAIDLDRAAAIEKELKKRYDGSCKINTKLGKAEDTGITADSTWGGNIDYYTSDDFNIGAAGVISVDTTIQ